MDYSLGAKMLIERMETHPEEFYDNGRFADLVDYVGNRGTKLYNTNPPMGDLLSDRDFAALKQALESVRERRLHKEVTAAIFGDCKDVFIARRAIAKMAIQGSSIVGSHAQGVIGTGGLINA
jgi:hypothetical protein